MARIYKKESLDKWNLLENIKIITTENLVGESDVEIEMIKECEREEHEMETSWMFKSSLTKQGDKYSFESPIYVSMYWCGGGCDDNWDHQTCTIEWIIEDKIQINQEIQYDRNELNKIFNKFIKRWIINRYDKIQSKQRPYR